MFMSDRAKLSLPILYWNRQAQKLDGEKVLGQIPPVYFFEDRYGEVARRNNQLVMVLLVTPLEADAIQAVMKGLRRLER